MDPFVLFSILLLPLTLHSQVTLQPGVEVFGNTNGEQLGKYVTGIVPSANVPYKAAVSKVGSTGIYRLNSPSDTSVQQVFFGENLLTGDLNNDGFKDVVVSKTVTGYDTVFIYWGTATGIDTLNPLKISGENQYDGLRPGCIGDINNDGIPDLLLRASDYPGQFSYGKVYVFLNPVQSPVPSGVVIGDSIRFYLGAGTSVGDLNDDGFNDLIVRGSKQSGAQETRYGYINVYWGVGIDTLHLASDLQMRTNVAAMPGLAVFDVNGDGKDDLLWTTTQTSINVHFGGVQFDTLHSLQLQIPASPTSGSVITNAGDMNGDGFNDTAIGDPRASITSGIIRIYAGGPNIDGVFDAAVSRGSESGFGTSVSALGDVSGDGLSDIIVGAPHDPFFNDRGYWGIFKGDSTITVTTVSEGKMVPEVFLLDQAYPNPFNPTVTDPPPDSGKRNKGRKPRKAGSRSVIF